MATISVSGCITCSCTWTCCPRTPPCGLRGRRRGGIGTPPSRRRSGVCHQRSYSSNRIQTIHIKVSRHHTVSISNFQSIEVSTDDRMVALFLDTGVGHGGLMVSMQDAGTPSRRFTVQILVWTDCVFSWCKNQALNIRDWWCSSWFGLHVKHNRESDWDYNRN